MDPLKRNIAILASGLAMTGGGTYLGYENAGNDQQSYGEQATLCAPHLGRQATQGLIPVECQRVVDNFPMDEVRVASTKRTYQLVYDLPSQGEMRKEAKQSLHDADVERRDAANVGMTAGLVIWGYGLFAASTMIELRKRRAKQQ